jgi:antitoxin ParD1/3/4
MSDTKRVTVSMPGPTAEQLTAMAEAAGAPSVSAYVTEAVQARMAREQALERLRQAWGDPDPEGMAWARQAILGSDSSPRAS